MNENDINVLPDSLDEAIELLKGFFHSDLSNIAAMPENAFLHSTHFRDGMFIRNNWNLWWYANHGYKEWPKDKPKLVEWFNSIDITHADDMSSILMVCLHRNLVGVEYDVEGQVEKYKRHWKANGYPDGIPRHDEI